VDGSEADRDAERLDKLERALVDSLRRSELLLALVLRLIEDEHRERRRLAKELHDGPQQLLYAASMKLELMRRKLEPAPELKERAASLIKESSTGVRAFTAELSPPISPDVGVGPALSWLAERTQAREGIEVEARVQDAPTGMDLRVSAIVFDAVRELLANVVRHSGAKRAEVEALKLPGDRVLVVVSDGGKGFEPDRVEATPERLGLFALRAELESIGGALEIESEPGSGTRVLITTPIRFSEEKTTTE